MDVILVEQNVKNAVESSFKKNRKKSWNFFKQTRVNGGIYRASSTEPAEKYVRVLCTNKLRRKAQALLHIDLSYEMLAPYIWNQVD